MTDSDSDNENVHFGHNVEAGILGRAREWTDLLPWLRLARTLRVAGSPPLILVTALTFMLWSPVFAVISDLPTTLPADPTASSSLQPTQRRMLAIAAHVRQLNPTELLAKSPAPSPPAEDSGNGTWLRPIAAVGWSLLVWLPAALLLVRQGALLSAGRPMISLRVGFIAALRQTPMAISIAVVPLICVLTVAFLILALGWLGKLFAGWPVMETIIAASVVLVAIPCGFLAFGANIAVPLAWAAATNERDADALDSLSRGYEYVMRRPLHLLWYALVGVVILSVIGGLTAAIAAAASRISLITLELAGSSPALGSSVVSMLELFPLIAMITLFWALVGGVYLLLRCDAGGQEVEDLWLPASAPPKAASCGER